MLDISFHAATVVVRVLWGEFLCDWMQESGLLQLQVPEASWKVNKKVCSYALRKGEKESTG